MRRKIYNDWNLNTAIEAYEMVGSKNPKWDETARLAIRQFIDAGSNRKKVYELLGKAIQFPRIRFGQGNVQMHPRRQLARPCVQRYPHREPAPRDEAHPDRASRGD